MIHLNKKQIENALPKVKKGLEKYVWLQTKLDSSSIHKDRLYQTKFNYFYRITPFRNQKWQKEFYELLETSKRNKNIVFVDILNTLYKKTGRIEASFASKLIATINPRLPVIDSVVLGNLRKQGNIVMRLPYSSDDNRIHKIKQLHNKLNQLFVEFLRTKNGKYLVKRFTKEYPNVNITKIKMLDLILWQTRQ